jgi:hypothetical protein
LNTVYSLENNTRFFILRSKLTKVCRHG